MNRERSKRRRRNRWQRGQKRRRVFRRLGNDRIRFTLDLTGAAKAPVGSPEWQAHAETLARFSIALGEDWMQHAQEPLPRRMPEDCPKERPCRHFLCLDHLAVERTWRGSLRLVNPHTPLEQLRYTCVRDVIRDNPGGIHLSEIGVLLGLKRQRVHQHWRDVERRLRGLEVEFNQQLTESDMLNRTHIANHDVHPAAQIFPELVGKELQELADDIRQFGLRYPIVLHEDKILDGRNRYRACLLADVEPRFTAWDDGHGSPVDYVVSLNLKRRHLDESQRAMVAAKALPMYREEAKKRQSAAGGAKPGPISLKLGETPGKAAEKAAAAVNVSCASVESAARVLKTGAPELVQAVETGAVKVSVAADLARLSKDEQKELIAQADEVAVLRAAKDIRQRKAQERRVERTEKLKSQSATPEQTEQALGRYPVIIADPPWQYEHDVSDSRAIENHYLTMTLHELKALPVSNVATADAMLFVWAPAAKTAEVCDVIKAWGWDYRTHFVWRKDKIGTGYYQRSRHELLHLAARGKPITPAEADRPESVLDAPRSDEHSRKPDLFAAMIDRMYPGLPKVELFARERRPGWAAIGNHIDGRDIRHVLAAAGENVAPVQRSE